MAVQEKYRIGVLCRYAGLIRTFDQTGSFEMCQVPRDFRYAAVFDSFDKAHYAASFLAACHPEAVFEVERFLSIPCRVASRPVTAQRSIDG